LLRLPQPVRVLEEPRTPERPQLAGGSLDLDLVARERLPGVLGGEPLTMREVAVAYGNNCPSPQGHSTDLISRDSEEATPLQTAFILADPKMGILTPTSA